MKHIILGTAGHIDHGKTSLIKTVTGVDCDRLKEEKRRGITIELGFASVALPGGQRLSIVDVPGHEKFIKNMVAGVGGIDAVVLVVAADEGIMPQTREHLDICSVLSVQHGIIALTKTDLVDDELRELVAGEIRDSVQHSFLKNAPIVAVSSATGHGIREFLSALEDLCSRVPSRSASGPFRLPVDRVFSMKGFGTVVTGSSAGGALAAGDEIEVMPGKKTAKIRGIQVHGGAVQRVEGGRRVALNLQGIDRTEVSRGDIIARPGTMRPTHRIAVRYHHLENAVSPLKHRQRVRFHAGTAELFGRVALADRSPVAPGEEAYMLISLEAPTAVYSGDRFVLRSYSPVTTIGGGEILDTAPPRRLRTPEIFNKRMDTLDTRDPAAAIALLCAEAGLSGISAEDLCTRCGISQKQTEGVLNAHPATEKPVVYSTKPLCITTQQIISEMEKLIETQLKAYHHQHSMKQGMPREALAAGLPRHTDRRMFMYALERMVKNSTLTTDQGTYCLAAHSPKLTGRQQKLLDTLRALYADAGAAPPAKKEIVQKLRASERDIDSACALLVRESELVKITDDLYYQRAAYSRLVDSIIGHLKKNGSLNIQQAKAVTGLSRKYMVPFLEHLDKQKLTLRQGDRRILRKKTTTKQ